MKTRIPLFLTFLKGGLVVLATDPEVRVRFPYATRFSEK
jgi:hypothetical protein